MKGKNFSCNNLGQRKESDFYETPYTMTRQFLATGELDASKDIIEPACGHGAIVKVLKEYKFKNIKHYDILEGIDFLGEKKHYSQLITNPPFSLAFQFIQKAKEVIDEEFALLLPLSYLHGKGRFDSIYSDKKYRLKSVYVFTRYPMLGDALTDTGMYRTGMMVYAWFVWNKSYKKEPVIRWLDNNEFVISSRKRKGVSDV